jgi:hypothetical protein
MATKKKCDKTIDAFSPRMETGQIKALLKSKGWKSKDVAVRWELTERRISQIVTDPTRNQHYDDAFLGLPNKLNT